MATSLKFYADAGLTTPLTSQTVSHNVDGSGDPQDVAFFLGSTTTNHFRNLNNPGVDDLIVEIVNATALWQAGHAYAVNDLARTTAKNGYQYKVQSVAGGGVSGASEPAWPTTIGNTVIDNEVTWVCVAKLHETNEIKLALTSVGLDAATPGASLNLGPQIVGGSLNAVPVFMRIDDATAVVGAAAELSLLVRDVEESPT